jgi:uncharacterized membrane protein
MVLLALVWPPRAGVTPGLSAQFPLVGALTLMHGWSLAVVAAGVVPGVDGLQHQDLGAWPANELCLALVPASVATLVLRVAEARLPRNYFDFFFVTAFAGSLLGCVLAALARLSLLWVSHSLPATRVGDEVLLLPPMFELAEAFMNGLVIAEALIYTPRWVVTFDEHRCFARPQI